MHVENVTVRNLREMMEAREAGAVDAVAFQKAADWCSDAAAECWDSDSVLETWTSALADIGIRADDISFTGFHSQGDGACFVGSVVDHDKLFNYLLSPPDPLDCISPVSGGKEDFKRWIRFHVGSITQTASEEELKRIDGISVIFNRHSHRYSHKGSVSTILDIDLVEGSEEYRENLEGRLEKMVEALRTSLCDAIFRMLREDYEHVTSDMDSLMEMSEANDFLFDEDGRRFSPRNRKGGAK